MKFSTVFALSLFMSMASHADQDMSAQHKSQGIYADQSKEAKLSIDADGKATFSISENCHVSFPLMAEYSGDFEEHFTYISNGVIESCGKHNGIGGVVELKDYKDGLISLDIYSESGDIYKGVLRNPVNKGTLSVTQSQFEG